MNETQFDLNCAEMFVMPNVISHFEARFKSFRVVIILIVNLRVVTPCIIQCRQQRFERTYCLIIRVEVRSCISPGHRSY
jgi:cytidine deaminase